MARNAPHVTTGPSIGIAVDFACRQTEALGAGTGCEDAMPKDRSEYWLQRVYGAQSTEELRDSYDQWAPDYDRNLEGVRYQNPPLAAGLIGRYVPPGTGEILDAGCGTGLLGDILVTLGYDGIVGIDLSEAMLAQAEARGVYRELRQMNLSEALDFPDGRFAACVAFGVLTKGHAPPAVLDEMLRVTRSGGHLIFSISEPAFQEGGFKERLAAIDGSGLWVSVEVTPYYRPIPDSQTEGDLLARLFVYRAR
jgi:SAM-dependent methyltransferase